NTSTCPARARATSALRNGSLAMINATSLGPSTRSSTRQVEPPHRSTVVLWLEWGGNGAAAMTCLEARYAPARARVTTAILVASAQVVLPRVLAAARLARSRA